MNRSMCQPNYGGYGRPMQRGDSCRQPMYTGGCPMPKPESCHPAQRPECGRPIPKPEPCRPAQRPECGRPMPKPEPCRPVREAERECSACKEGTIYTRSQMLQYINEVSFAVNDILLYLDTHPCDREAMKYYDKYVAKREKALCDFAKFYGPLTVDTADTAQSEHWEWVLQPWPWEGGDC